MQHSITRDAGRATLRVRGELDALTSSELRPALDGLADTPEVIVDLTDLRLIDSSGVGALVSLFKRVRENGGNVQFVGAAAQPLAIFKLLRLDQVFGLDGA